jgi:hypothetical protein
MLTESDVTLSLGGCASRTPPFILLKLKKKCFQEISICVSIPLAKNAFRKAAQLG